MKALCIKAKIGSRRLKLHPNEAQQTQRTVYGQEADTVYSLRAGIESVFSQDTRHFGLRQARYRGITKTHLQNLAVASAINLNRAT